MLAGLPLVAIGSRMVISGLSFNLPLILGGIILFLVGIVLVRIDDFSQARQLITRANGWLAGRQKNRRE